MNNQFQRDEVRFRYPDGWSLEVENVDSGWTVSLTGDGASFLVISNCPGVDDPAELGRAALEGLAEDYKELEVDEAVSTIAGQPAYGFDVQFFHMDLTNECMIRAMPTQAGSLLVMLQQCDADEESVVRTLESIINSIEFDDGASDNK